MGPVELRMMSGCPPKTQNTVPARAVPRKLSITPLENRDEQEVRRVKQEVRLVSRRVDLVVVGGVPQQTPEGDGVGDAAQVDEEHGRDALDVEPVVDVAAEPRNLPLDVEPQAASEPEEPAVVRELQLHGLLSELVRSRELLVFSPGAGRAVHLTELVQVQHRLPVETRDNEAHAGFTGRRSQRSPGRDPNVHREEIPTFTGRRSQRSPGGDPNVHREEIPTFNREEIPTFNREEIPTFTGRRSQRLTGRRSQRLPGGDPNVYREEIPMFNREEIPTFTGRRSQRLTGRRSQRLPGRDPNIHREEIPMFTRRRSQRLPGGDPNVHQEEIPTPVPTTLTTLPALSVPHFRRCNLLGGLDADLGVPLARRQHDDLVQELVHAGDQILAVPGLVGDIAEELVERKRSRSRRRDGSADLVVGFGFPVRAEQDEEEPAEDEG
ncbi:hypothetical protein EYF80_046786 [Liparis tanakae]|uniref:Uncharacterized protein n=1 Tax=Liparis tanakae TaxID=230148 RepID=A0A4Z2FQ25_9TELE|nr:hypothetical protein EYF80_046786 [Liparis tanakae]